MNKILIYTAITGGYDSLQQPFLPAEGFDFICFVSKGMKRSDYEGAWYILEIPYSWEDMTLLARSHKLCAHNLMPDDYEYSLWIDGNIRITNDSIYRICRSLAERDVHFAGIKHPFRDCVYEEMEAVLRDRRESFRKILRLAEFLCRNRFPRHAGLMETNVMFRKQNDPVVEAFDRWWWECVVRYSVRDQLTQSFAIADTEGMSFEYLLPEGMSARNFPGLEYVRHNPAEKPLTWMQRKRKYGLNDMKVLALRIYIAILRIRFGKGLEKGWKGPENPGKEKGIEKKSPEWSEQ